MKDLPKEFDELVAAAKVRNAGESLFQYSLRVGLELVDVVAGGIAALDEKNLGDDLAELGLQAEKGVSKLAGVLLAKRPWLAASMKPAIGLGVPVAIAAIGVYAPRVQKLSDHFAKPLAEAATVFGARLAAGLAGK